MPHSEIAGAERRSEAERLIGLARAMLVDEAEQIAATYLEHAAIALGRLPSPTGAAITGPATPPSPDPARPAP